MAAAASTSKRRDSPRASASSRASSILTLSPPGAVGSLQEADLALAELARLEAEEKLIQADCDRALEGVRTQYAGRMRVSVDGVLVPFADRRQQLAEQLEAFATANRDEILEDDKKSRRLNHGEIGWRKQKDTIVPIEGGDPDGRVTVRKLILDHIWRALEKVEKVAPVFTNGLLRFIRIKVTFDKTALLTARQKGQLSATKLVAAGFKMNEGEDKFYWTAKAKEIASESAQQPPAGGA